MAATLIATLGLTAFAPPPHVTSGPQPKSWKPLTDLLTRWPYTDNFLLQVGNADGLVYEYSRGNMTPSAHVGTASTSKWPSAMALLGVVADGSIESLDSPVNKYVPWWTTNTSDPRAHVTLRHLLSFTSGFGNGMPGNESYKELECMHWQGNITYEACAKQVHDKVEQWCSPGSCFSYNANHLKLAGVVAMHATGLTIQQVIHKYMNVGLRMNDTHCSYTPNGSHVALPEPNPDLSVCLNTTGGDYASFLDGVLNHKVLTPALIAESEKDATPGAMMGGGYTLYGHYGFGHFLECFDSYRGFTLDCKKAQVHADPGAFGYYPLLDRRYGYWMQIAAYEHGGSYPRSGIPEYLRVLAKPYVDLLIQGKDLNWNQGQLKTLSMDALDYINDCYFHPEHCK